jgi:predicted DNA-binding WGR domain protein
VLRLYKKEGDTLRYWEAWVHEDSVTVHWGIVGQTGEEKVLPLPADEDPDMVVAQQAEPLVDAGYDEPEIDSMAPLVVQYALQGKGSGQDFEKRHTVESVISDTLGWTGNGEVEGAESQPGRMNIYFRVMDVDIALSTLREALESEEMLEGATFATAPEEGEPRVLWPPVHAVPFRL